MTSFSALKSYPCRAVLPEHCKENKSKKNTYLKDTFIPTLFLYWLWSSIFNSEGVATLKGFPLVPAGPAAPVKILPLFTDFLLFTVLRGWIDQPKTSCPILLDGNFFWWKGSGLMHVSHGNSPVVAGQRRNRLARTFPSVIHRAKDKDRNLKYFPEVCYWDFCMATWHGS